jgi:hypothetical protein
MTYPITTTLNRIFDANPCINGRKRALAAAGKSQPDDEPITFQQIVDAVGIADALWCCRAEPQHSRVWRLYAVWCARQVQHLMADPRSVAALDVAERHANGQATDDELAAANSAAWSAAEPAAWSAAESATRSAAWAASWAARAATRSAAWDASWDSARSAQQEAFIQLVTTGTLPEARGVCE